MSVNPLIREQIGQSILNLARGQETETVLLAQADALATCVGGIMHLSGKSVSEAEALVDELANQMRDHVRKNWSMIEKGDVQ